MKGYTRLNLKGDIEDQAPKFGLGEHLEFRVARDGLGTEESALSYLRIASHYRMPFGHTHKRQEEVYVVVSGSARLKLDDDVLDLVRWDAVRIANGTVRDLEAGPDGVELILFGAPNTGSNDAEMIQEWWTG